MKLSKYFISMLLSILWSISFGQITYEMDTSGMIIQRGVDTIYTVDSKIETSMNMRFSNGDDKGVLLIRTFDNPSMSIYNESQEEVIQFRANYDGTNDSRIITDEIQIDGGSDLAELFDITNESSIVKPGYLVSLDPDHPGKLMLSNSAYDKKVAGVLSGANGVKPGILMGQDETIATGDDLVTLSGRTYVMANDLGGEINVGDLITTSKVQGEAMKAKKKKKGQGAIIGKAMTPLKEGKGYVLVLVNLQ